MIEKGFIVAHGREQFLTQYTRHLIDMKPYLFNAPSLHIFVVTTSCNGDCIYCQAKSHNTGGGLMMKNETAEKAIDLVLESPSPYITVEFQGGEPLLNFETIRYIVETFEQKQSDKDINFSIVTNLTKITDEMIDFFSTHNVSVSTSLDGNKSIQNHNRPMKDKSQMYDGTISGIHSLRNHNVPVGAIQTTTSYSLDKANSIIEEYVTLGMNSVFIRPLTPLGMAHEQWNNIGYSTEQYKVFYKQCLLKILEFNQNGYYLTEGHAHIFLKKILLQHAENYMELRSPCGAGLGQIAYYPNGDIYTCDEARMLAEMGDKTFKMGNVFTSTYDDLISGNACKAVCKYSILESLPSCSECVYQPYCGVCPIVNYALNRDIVERQPNDYRCALYKGMLDILFELLQNEEYHKIFLSWVRSDCE